ncbi:MAG: hypothetical protein RL095_2884 [Verrucomicrobiota bacterium]|jgi:signal transduction histidine kinase
MNIKPHILVIDDEQEICDMVRRWFGFDARVSTIRDPLAAVDWVVKGDYDCILIDYSMPEMSGMDLLSRLLETGRTLPPLVMMTGHGSLELAMNFIRSGGSDFLEKPLNMELLSARLLHLSSTHLQKKRIRELEKERDILMAALTHDIRSPLGVIINVIELLRDSQENKEQHMLDLLFESSRYLHALTDDFLIIAKEKSSSLSFSPSTVDADAVLTNLSSQLGIAARLRKIQLELQLPEEKTLIETDITRFRQVLTNLADNALKHSHCKKLQIQVSHKGEQAVFSIRDDGKGLPEEVASHLMTAFKRSSSDSGFGLGLAICARLCKSLGSELQYHRLEKGGVFFFELPLAARPGIHSTQSALKA